MKGELARQNAPREKVQLNCLPISSFSFGIRNSSSQKEANHRDTWKAIFENHLHRFEMGTCRENVIHHGNADGSWLGERLVYFVVLIQMVRPGTILSCVRLVHGDGLYHQLSHVYGVTKQSEYQGHSVIVKRV